MSLPIAADGRSTPALSSRAHVRRGLRLRALARRFRGPRLARSLETRPREHASLRASNVGERTPSTFIPADPFSALIGRWCNGSTADFGSACPGSNPGRPALSSCPQTLPISRRNPLRSPSFSPREWASACSRICRRCFTPLATRRGRWCRRLSTPAARPGASASCSWSAIRQELVRQAMTGQADGSSLRCRPSNWAPAMRCGAPSRSSRARRPLPGTMLSCLRAMGR